MVDSERKIAAHSTNFLYRFCEFRKVMIIEEKQSPFFRLSVLICAALELAEEGGHSLQAVSTHSYYIELLFKKDYEH